MLWRWEVWDEQEEGEGRRVHLPALETQTMAGSWGWSYVGPAGCGVQAEPGAGVLLSTPCPCSFRQHSPLLQHDPRPRARGPGVG